MRAEILEDQLAITDDSRGATHVYVSPEEAAELDSSGTEYNAGMMVGSTKALGHRCLT